jgi:uncharacterized protein involved in exopolysaccharide biosynthesis
MDQEYLRYARDVESRYNVLQYMESLSQQENLEERRTVNAVQILDQAVPSEKNSGPQRLLIVFGGGLMGLLGASLLSVFHYNWNYEKEHNTSFFKSVVIGMKTIRGDFTFTQKPNVWMQNI